MVSGRSVTKQSSASRSLRSNNVRRRTFSLNERRETMRANIRTNTTRNIDVARLLAGHPLTRPGSCKPSAGAVRRLRAPDTRRAGERDHHCRPRTRALPGHRPVPCSEPHPPALALARGVSAVQPTFPATGRIAIRGGRLARALMESANARAGSVTRGRTCRRQHFETTPKHRRTHLYKGANRGGLDSRSSRPLLYELLVRRGIEPQSRERDSLS